MNIFKKINNKSRYYLNKVRCGSFGKYSYIDKTVRVFSYRDLYLNNFVSIYYNNFIMNENGRLYIGRNSHIAPGCYINCNDSKVCIGNNVAIGPQTCIIACSNYYKLNSKSIDVHCHKKGNVDIGDNVFIGANVTICPNISIASNCVIGAGSIVNKNIEEPGVYAGVPIKKIRGFNFK